MFFKLVLVILGPGNIPGDRGKPNNLMFSSKIRRSLLSDSSGNDDRGRSIILTNSSKIRSFSGNV